MVSSGNQRPSEKGCVFFVRLKRCLKMHTQTNPNRMLLYITICVHELIYTLPTAIKTKGRQKRENLIPPCPPHLAVKTHSFVAAARYGRENFQCTQSPNFMIGNTLVLKVVIEWPSRKEKLVLPHVVLNNPGHIITLCESYDFTEYNELCISYGTIGIQCMSDKPDRSPPLALFVKSPHGMIEVLHHWDRSKNTGSRTDMWIIHGVIFLVTFCENHVRELRTFFHCRS